MFNFFLGVGFVGCLKLIRSGWQEVQDRKRTRYWCTVVSAAAQENHQSMKLFMGYSKDD